MKEDNAPSPTKPQFSPREKLVEVALHSEDNRYFARNIVNRLWARMLGRGLVDPLDQMHSANVPSHPELLDWLTRDLVAHGYDLKRLLRGIALSQTYSRSSEWTSPGELPASSLFAVAKIKPLSPRQYGLSLSVASHNPTQWPTFDQAEQWAICSRVSRTICNANCGTLRPASSFGKSATTSQSRRMIFHPCFMPSRFRRTIDGWLPVALARSKTSTISAGRRASRPLIVRKGSESTRSRMISSRDWSNS